MKRPLKTNQLYRYVLYSMPIPYIIERFISITIFSIVPKQPGIVPVFERWHVDDLSTSVALVSILGGILESL